MIEQLRLFCQPLPILSGRKVQISWNSNWSPIYGTQLYCRFVHFKFWKTQISYTCPCFQIICYKQSPWIIGNRNFIKKTLHKVYNLWVIWVLTPVLWRAWSHTTTFPALKTRQHSKRKKSKHSDLYYQTNVFFCWTGVSHYWTQYRNSSICKWLNHDPR